MDIELWTITYMEMDSVKMKAVTVAGPERAKRKVMLLAKAGFRILSYRKVN